MTRSGKGPTAWVAEWIVWDTLNRRCEQGRASGTKLELDPFGSIDSSTACGLAAEGAMAARESVASLERSRRIRWGAFGKVVDAAKLLAESTTQVAEAAGTLAAGVPKADLDAIENSSDVRPMAALVCSQAISGQCATEYSVIVLDELIASLDEILGPEMSDTARSWIKDLERLTRLLRDSAEESGQLAYAVANMLKVSETVAAATTAARRVAQLVRESDTADDDDAVARAMQNAGAEEAARTEELTRLAAQRSDFDLSILSALWSLGTANGALSAAMNKINDIGLEEEGTAQVAWMVGYCALTSSVAHCGALVGLMLLRSGTLTPDDQRLESLRRQAITSCAVSIIFTTAVLRLVAGSVGAEEAADLIDEYEQLWLGRYDVVWLVRAI